MCGEEGHGEEDCPQADVDMPPAKRRVTFARPPVGVGVSQTWGVETWTVSPSTDSAEARLETWTSQDIQESTNLMSVTLTMSEGHAILDCGAALDYIGEVAAARTAQAITACGETRRPPQFWTKFNVSSLVVMVILWKRHLLCLCLFKLVTSRRGSKRLWFLAALLI